MPYSERHLVISIYKLDALLYKTRKNLKFKKAYFRGFSAENEQNKYIFGKKMKSLLYKNVLIFFLGGLEKNLGARLYFFVVFALISVIKAF